MLQQKSRTTTIKSITSLIVLHNCSSRHVCPIKSLDTESPRSFIFIDRAHDNSLISFVVTVLVEILTTFQRNAYKVSLGRMPFWQMPKQRRKPLASDLQRSKISRSVLLGRTSSYSGPTGVDFDPGPAAWTNARSVHEPRGPRSFILRIRNKQALSVLARMIPDTDEQPLFSCMMNLLLPALFWRPDHNIQSAASSSITFFPLFNSCCA